MRTVLVLGNATVDVIQHVPRLPVPGETLLSDVPLRCPGGKGLNQAIVAARTGAATTLVAPVGRDADAEFLAAAAAADGLRAVWLNCDAPTDLSSIWVAADGENMIVSSAAAAHSVAAAQVEGALRNLGPDDILLLQGNLSAEITRGSARTARQGGAKIILNTAPIAWSMELVLKDVDLVVANSGEAAALTGREGLEAARALGVPAAVLTLGARGAFVADPEGTIEIAAPRVAAIDASGAGDVLVGTLVGCLSQGLALRASATVAIAAASLSVTRRGTMPSFPTRAEIGRLLAAFC